MVAVRVLGPLELCDAQRQPVTVGSRLRRRLLSALVLHRGSIVTPDRLAELVWSEGEAPANVANAVQTHVTRLRRILPPTVSLVTEGHGYRLGVDSADVDAGFFGDLVEAAGVETEPQRRAALLGEALDLWRGVPYVELDHPSGLAEAARLGEARLDVLEHRAEALWASASPTEAIALLQVLIGEAPLREGPVALLMQYLVATGRQGDALRGYGRLREALRDELGIDPSPALQDLERRVLTQEVWGATTDVAPAAPGPPTPRTTPAGAAPPPVPPSSFVGRQQELREVVELLAGGGEVTLHGPGGVGKTRLARQIAAAASGEFRDGLAFVDLSTVRAGGRVREAVAVALHLELRGEEQLDEHLHQILSVGRRLLILDCCEHVVDDVAALVEDILAVPGPSAVLCTSREPLRIDGERVVRLGPLSPSLAAELFVDRMRSAGHPPAEIADLELIGQICEALDLLPLAIELAAARVPTVGLAGLRDGLDRRFELLRSGRRTAAPHHRSLRDVVEWSYGLLRPDEQEVFRRFSVFAGSVELDHAVAVIADADVSEATVRATLPDLADRCLVVSDASSEGTRYRLLDTLRAFGRELGGGHEPDLRARYVAWARRFADAARVGERGRDERSWSRRVDGHLPELLQAYRWLGEDDDVAGQLAIAAALGRHAMFRYRIDVALVVEEAADVAEGVLDPNLPEVLGCAGTMAWQRGRLGEAERLGRRCVAVADALGDPQLARFGGDVLANVALFRGEFHVVRAEAERTIELAHAADDHVLEMAAYVELVLASAYAGDEAAADDAEARAAGLVEAMDGPMWRGRFAYLRGERLALEDPEAAVQHLEEAIRLGAGDNSQFLVGVARHTLVTTAARRLDPLAAVASFLPLIEHWHRTGAWNQLWGAMRGLTAALTRADRYRDAALLLGAHDGSASATRPFGADAEMLTQVLEDLRTALGGELSGLLREGADLGDDRALTLALDVMRTAEAEAEDGSSPAEQDAPAQT